MIVIDLRMRIRQPRRGDLSIVASVAIRRSSVGATSPDSGSCSEYAGRSYGATRPRSAQSYRQVAPPGLAYSHSYVNHNHADRVLAFIFPLFLMLFRLQLSDLRFDLLRFSLSIHSL